MECAEKNNIVARLQKEISAIQGFKNPSAGHVNIGLGAIETAFPDHVFPTGVIHEFRSNAMESAAATSGFMAGLLSSLMGQAGLCLWISARRNLFPPALILFGIEPERIIFIDVRKETDVLWAMEEALKCEALSAVVGELSEISFAQSRRLQLAVEHSHVTGFMHCYNPNKINNTTCVTRWKITPLASAPEEGMPGVGYPNWQVELLKIRNGKPGTWQLQWAAGQFQPITKPTTAPDIQLPKTG